MLELKQRKPVAEGRHRWVFDDPQDSRRLIKVMADVDGKRFASRPWYKRAGRSREFRVFVRELSEFIAMRARAHERPYPIAAVHGLVETDLGLGLVVEKQIGSDGHLAQTAADLIRRDGFAPWIAQALETWIQSVIDHNVILGDLHAGNLVFGSDDGLSPRFVMIDGFGEKNLVPRCSMSSSFNAWHSRHLFNRLLQKIDSAASPLHAAAA